MLVFKFKILVHHTWNAAVKTSNMKTLQSLNLLALFIIARSTFKAAAAQETKGDRAKYGRLVGGFISRLTKHGVTGTVYAVDDSNIFIRGFSYDNSGVDAFFYFQNRGSDEIFKVNFPAGRNKHGLEKYSYENIVLTLPRGQNVSSIEFLSVRKRNSVEEKDLYGLVLFSPNLSVPRPRKIGKFATLHVSSDYVIIKDTKTLFIPKFRFNHYAAPRTYFFVGNSTSRENPITKVPDQNGSYALAREYTDDDLTIELPDELNIYDIQWLSVWSTHLKREFGHVGIPMSQQELNVPPQIGKEPLVNLPLQATDYDYKEYNIPNLTSRKSTSSDDKNACGVNAVQSNLQITCVLTFLIIIISVIS